MDDLLADFLTETNESLAELDVALVNLERTPDDAATLSLIFRLVHTIKGTCGFLGLPRLEHVAHAAENVLGKLRDHSLTVTPDIISQVLAALDRIKFIVAALHTSGAEPPGDDAPLIADLNATATGSPPAQVAAEPMPTPAPTPAPVAAPEPPPPAAVAPVPTSAPEAPPPKTAAPPSAEETAAAAGSSSVGAQTIRVTVDVLEDLMTLE